MEARKMLKEEAKGTSADETLVGALMEKWEPMLKGLASKTQADRYTMGVTAMLMENQSQYLQTLNEETKQVNVGSFTKFIFPVLT